MAIIGKIRGYSGLLIAIIGLGLAAFVLQDFWSGGSTQRGTMEVGEVNKNKISYPEFNQRYTEELEMYKMRRGLETIDPHDDYMVRQQTWERLINEYLLIEQIEKLGIQVSSDELSDMFFGPEPHPFVASAFSPDPMTGQVDREQMIQVLQSLDPFDPRLIRLENDARKQRKQEKYFKIIEKAYYAPKAFAELYYKEKNFTADIKYVFKKYDQISDSLVAIDDAAMLNAYNEIKHLYKQDEMRDAEFVVLPVFPSQEDREKIENDVLQLKEDLKTVSKNNVESFVNAVSDKRFDPEFKSPGTLNPKIDSLMFNSPEGTIYGPYLHENHFVISMLNNIELRPDSMSAAHILISYREAFQADPNVTRSYQDAKEKADSLLEVMKTGRIAFANVAAEVSDDPSAAFNQGDLGWFKDGQMVPAFNQAVIDNPVGSYVVAETEYGFHVIIVNAKSRPVKKIQVAHIAREVVPSSITYQKVYSEASNFAQEVRNTKNFKGVAAEKDLVIRSAPRLKEMDNNMPGVLNPREIVRWAFAEETKVGSVSRIFEIEDRFIIAHLTKVREEGIPPMDQIEEQVRNHALNQKKFEYITAQINMIDFQSLDLLAEEMGLKVQDVFEIKYGANILSGAGREPFVIGKAFAYELFEISEPIKGNDGVFVLEVIRKDDEVTPTDYNIVQNEIQRSFNNRLNRLVMEALKNNARIRDYRSWYY